MRLIDADALIGNTIIGGRRNNKTIIRYIVTNIVQNAPTVDAVPVLYIKETIAWAKENGSVEYADYLSHLLSAWAERKEE